MSWTGVGNASMAAVKCLGDCFEPDYQQGLDLNAHFEAITANTRERAKQPIAYNWARSGSVTELSSGDTCEPWPPDQTADRAFSARAARQAPKMAIRPGTRISAQMILERWVCTKGRLPKK